jgi:hypothetical protein
VSAELGEANGKIVGRSLNLAAAQVEPGVTVSFSFSQNPPPEIVSANASVDPCDWVSATVEAEECPLTLPAVELSQVPGH